MLSYHPPIAGHPGQRRIYDMLRHEIFWQQVAADAEHIVSEYQGCARNNPTYCHKQNRQHFPAAAPLEFIAMDILEPFSKTTQHNEYIHVIRDCYSQSKRAIPTSDTTFTHIGTLFFDYWLVLYRISTYFLADEDVQFTSKFFATLCTLLGVKHLTTTPYHPQTNGQAEIYYKTILTCLRNYIAEHQKDRDIFVMALKDPYTTHVHHCTNHTPRRFVTSQHLPGPAFLCADNIV